jgi:hypothetical protein
MRLGKEQQKQKKARRKKQIYIAAPHSKEDLADA